MPKFFRIITLVIVLIGIAAAISIHILNKKTPMEPQTRANTQTGEVITIEGVAENSKAGVVVNGVILMGVPEGDERYIGKKVKVTGTYLDQDSDFLPVVDENGAISQGHSLPILTVQSIEVIQ